MRAPDLVETGDALSSAYQTWRVALIKLKVHTNRALQLGGGGGLEGGGGWGGGGTYTGVRRPPPQAHLLTILQLR